MSCTICLQSILTATQRYLIDSGKGKLNVRELLSNLPFSVNICSAHVCKTCLQKVKKRQDLKDQEAKLLEEIRTLTDLCRQDKQIKVSGSSKSISESDCRDVDVVGSKLFRADFSSSRIPVSPVRTTTVKSTTHVPNTPLHSTPRKRPLFPYGHAEIPVQPHLQPQQPTNTSSSSNYYVPISVKVQWASETRERTLSKDLESLEKMLVRGTYKQIARASWQNPKLRKELQVFALKDIDKECHTLYSQRRPSCLRSPSKEQLQSFSFEKLNKEMDSRAPFLKAILRTACVNNRNASKPNEWMPTIGMAAAVFLRNRSSRLNAVQLLLSILLCHSSWTVSEYHCVHIIAPPPSVAMGHSI
jgi:hypothetical protein